MQLTIYNLIQWIWRSWLPFSGRIFVGKYLKTLMHKKPVEMSKYEDAHKHYLEYKKEFVPWLVKRDKATGDEKKWIDKHEQPTPGDAHGLYKYEYLNYKNAMDIWRIRKEETTCDKEKKWLEKTKPERPLPPQPQDSEINEFVSKYLKVCTCAHSSVLSAPTRRRKGRHGLFGSCW